MMSRVELVRARVSQESLHHPSSCSVALPSRHLSSSELQVFGKVDMRLCLLLVAGATALPRPQGGDQIRCFARPKQVHLSRSNQDHIVVLCLSFTKTRLLKELNFSQERMGGRRGLGQRKPGKQLDLMRGSHSVNIENGTGRHQGGK